MKYETIDLSFDGGLARLKFTQSARGNPIDGPACKDFLAAINEISNHSDARAVLISAEGRFFSVGGDVQAFVRDLDILPERIRQWTADLHMGLARLARLDTPLVVAAHATTMGGALALIANCDLVFGAQSAMFGSAYTQIGYSCDAGASFGLASRMGIARARRFVILAETLTAEQAAQTGLIDFAIADDELYARAEEAALKLSRGPTRAYGEIRRLFRKALAQPFEAQLEDEAQALARIAGSQDAREGLTAFAGKRKPQFTGQ